ncbi:hypothetical protein FHT00_001089 [Sphingomonas insulae]|uniref:Uncharacterized protein n=1 Tax=Sphingomonas insulae TaxID=424800 RepID=A0ABN1HRY2_9SPHN|nr:hypothetical protein [Sphingomonas insulae]NIJ29156.1 hypothetical protein [Sphingomonas insulae]
MADETTQDDKVQGNDMNGQKQDRDREGQEAPSQAPDTGNDTDESGAGYGNHGDVRHDATGG